MLAPAGSQQSQKVIDYTATNKMSSLVPNLFSYGQVPYRPGQVLSPLPLRMI
jgi:hypothetical protein